MATKEQVQAALIGDGAFRRRIAMTHEERIADLRELEARFSPEDSPDQVTFGQRSFNRGFDDVLFLRPLRDLFWQMWRSVFSKA